MVNKLKSLLTFFSLVPHAPSNAILHRTSATTGTVTWTEAQAPFDFYELIITPAGGADRVYQIQPGSNSFMLDTLEAGVTYGFRLVSVVNTPNNANHQTIKSPTADITLVAPCEYTLE